MGHSAGVRRLGCVDNRQGLTVAFAALTLIQFLPLVVLREKIAVSSRGWGFEHRGEGNDRCDLPSVWYGE